MVGRSVGLKQFMGIYCSCLVLELAWRRRRRKEKRRREGYNGSTIVRVSQWSTEEEKERKRALVYFGRRSNQESNSGATAMCVLSLSTFFRGNQEEAESSSSPPFSLIALPSLPAAFVEPVPPSLQLGVLSPLKRRRRNHSFTHSVTSCCITLSLFLQWRARRRSLHNTMAFS